MLGLLVSGLLFLFLITINLVATIVVHVPMPAVGENQFDAAIVLGYPAQADGQPSPILAQRVRKGVELFGGVLDMWIGFAQPL
ncbi:hypothetical protein BST81_02135 [Leptolyngbya sp. 'hensonii']|nr:hypothetical protein BST81_02135 [Leptolyngbya sp. 'hensonii']